MSGNHTLGSGPIEAAYQLVMTALGCATDECLNAPYLPPCANEEGHRYTISSIPENLENL